MLTQTEVGTKWYKVNKGGNAAMDLEAAMPGCSTRASVLQAFWKLCGLVSLKVCWYCNTRHGLWVEALVRTLNLLGMQKKCVTFAAFDVFFHVHQSWKSCQCLFPPQHIFASTTQTLPICSFASSARSFNVNTYPTPTPPHLSCSSAGAVSSECSPSSKHDV